MTDINELRRLALDGDLAAMQEIIHRLEAAEKERDDVAQQLVQSEIGKREISEAHNVAKRRLSALAGENIALQAKIVEMERQEPVGTTGGMPGTTGFTMACFHADKVPIGTKLYALPGAKGEEK